MVNSGKATVTDAGVEQTARIMKMTEIPDSEMEQIVMEAFANRKYTLLGLKAKVTKKNDPSCHCESSSADPLIYAGAELPNLIRILNKFINQSAQKRLAPADAKCASELAAMQGFSVSQFWNGHVPFTQAFLLEQDCHREEPTAGLQNHECEKRECFTPSGYLVVWEEHNARRQDV